MKPLYTEEIKELYLSHFSKPYPPRFLEASLKLKKELSPPHSAAPKQHISKRSSQPNLTSQVKNMYILDFSINGMPKEKRNSLSKSTQTQMI